MWKMLMIAIVSANGAYHTMYFQISHPNGGEFSFPSEQECLDRVDGVAHAAQAREWVPGRKTQALPVGAICLPSSLADFIRTTVTPKIPNKQVGQVQIPTDVLTDYTPPKPAAAGPPAPAPAPIAPAPPSGGQPKAKQ